MDTSEAGPSQTQTNKRPLDPNNRTPLPKRPNLDPSDPEDDVELETDIIRIEVSKVLIKR